MAFSAIEFHTRLEVQDLLNRFCYSLERCDRPVWHGVFTRNATFSSTWLGDFHNLDEIALIPALMHERGDGAWRFHMFNLVLFPGVNRSLLTAKACMAVFDGENQDKPPRLSDCSFKIRHAACWQITHVDATCVAKTPKVVSGDAPAIAIQSGLIN